MVKNSKSFQQRSKTDNFEIEIHPKILVRVISNHNLVKAEKSSRSITKDPLLKTPSRSVPLLKPIEKVKTNSQPSLYSNN